MGHVTMWDMHRRLLAVTLAITGAPLVTCVVVTPRPAPELVLPAVVAMIFIIALITVMSAAPPSR